MIFNFLLYKKPNSSKESWNFSRKFKSMNLSKKKSFFKCLMISCATLFFSANIALFADTTHTVAKGETLYSISRKYQITVAELRLANNMTEKDVLKSGQKLTIPNADISTAAIVTSSPSKTNSNSETIAQGSEYVVKSGDTFYGIARKSGITVSELYAANDLGSDAVLKVGQKLKIPKKSSESSKAVETSTKSTENLPDLKSADPRKYTEGNLADSKLVWPVKNPKVTYVKGKVSGVQLTCKTREDVTAIMAGTVMYCGVYRGFGQIVFVQSKTGLIYAYTGLSSVEIQKGDYVVQGKKLGEAGVDTITNQSQITLMVFQNGVPIDPAKAPRG